MVGIDDLRVLGKSVMASAVEAEILGLDRVTEYLGMAFDEVAREAVKVRARVAAEEARMLLVSKGNGAGGS